MVMLDNYGGPCAIADGQCRTQAEQQVKGFSNNHFKGYTLGDGGRVRTEKDYLEYVQSAQRREAQDLMSPSKKI